MVTIHDRIYGKFSITEPVLLELLETPSLHRLKNVSQFGIPDRYFFLKSFSRYEHSVGVMLLLRKHNAPLEEQVAGLLHDVSVPAFSHIADWLWGKGAQGIEDFHNTLHEEFVHNTELPDLLSKHEMDVNYILEDRNFPLLESVLPDLCADRIDYSLREVKDWQNPAAISGILSGLTVHAHEFVFTDVASAYSFASSFLEIQKHHWGAHEDMLRYYVFSHVLRKAIEQGVVAKSDFFVHDEHVMTKVESSNLPEIQVFLSELETGDIFQYQDIAGKKIIKKFRYVDPKIKTDSGFLRLSKIHPHYKQELATAQKENEEGMYVREL